ncbi:MAG: HAD-IIIA family hydrolase [Nanoarchaeota archaeon]|nr:HAD-IIIA family hydrolase [Nanoarchaeota archaeon]
MRPLAVFLDRDGTINKSIDQLYKKEQFELLPRAAEAIHKINSEGIKVIVVTNQPVVARGLCTEKDVQRIHELMSKELNQFNAFVDEILFCPHHPNANLVDYRKDCECRKPKIGMLKKAAEKFDLDLKKCFMIGDLTQDIKAGKDAGCKTVLVKTGHAGKDKKYEVTPDYIAEDLYEAVNIILQENL